MSAYIIKAMVSFSFCSFALFPSSSLLVHRLLLLHVIAASHLVEGATHKWCVQDVSLTSVTEQQMAPLLPRVNRILSPPK